MPAPLPFFNWSIQKALDTSTDRFTRAQINIIFSLLVFSIVKSLVVMSTGIFAGQGQQTVRASIALVLYLSMIKLLLYSPSLLKVLSHLMLVAGLIIVTTNIFVYTYNINLLTVQFVFMMVLGSFYTLGSRWGIVYSIAGVLPVLIFLTFNSKEIYGSNNDQELVSPGFEILAVLNFLTIVISHYLFYKAFDSNLKEKEQLNEKLRLSVTTANKLAASRSDFLSTMSHELRTPLNSVIGITELLLQDKPEERQKENLQILYSSSHDLLSLINNVLDINKIDSEKMVLELTPFRLSTLTRNISSGLRVKAEGKKLQLLLDIDEQLEHIHVNSDPTRLSQVIYNLAGNAIKFTPSGKINIQLKCINKTENNMEVLFSIADTGVGIHPDKHASIFEMFTQAESNTTRNYGGTGLGLAIVKKVLNLFESKITLESSPGKGSTFSFTIKFAVVQVEKQTGGSVIPASSFQHLKLLIAEDNDVNKMIIKKQLNNLNIFPHIVDNGEQAYKASLSDTYDAIFLDLHMPVMTGYETVKQIRASEDPAKSKVYMIAFTASVTEQHHILTTGFDDFLYKPVSMDELNIKLKKIAERKMEL